MRNYRVTVNGHVYEIGVEFLNEIAEPASALAAPAVRSAPTETQTAPMPPQSVCHGDNAVLSPLPGKIVELCVQEGTAVEEGQPVLILEAMKMENEVLAPASGIVKKMYVSEGAIVAVDEVLFEIA